MNDSTGLLNRLIRPAAALTLGGVIIAWTIIAGGASPADRHAKARKVAKGDTGVMPMPGPLASEPQLYPSDAILPNTRQWFLPAARPGYEPPNVKPPRLEVIHMRPTTLAGEYAMEARGAQPYPELPPMSPLAWAPSTDPSELSVPVPLSGRDGGGAKLSNDPTSAQSRLAVLTGRPVLRQAPAPFLRLTIPDPFGLIDAVKLKIRAMPPDNDPPDLPQTPPDPTMPASPKK